MSRLHELIIEALSLSSVTADIENYSARMKALFHYHQQYPKALNLFEERNYTLADETLLALIFWAEKYELHAGRIAVAEFLMRTIRMYCNAAALKYFKDIPENHGEYFC